MGGRRRRPTLYLSGHLHKTSANVSVVGTSRLLTIQAGAAFQARQDEKWINRILWGHIEEGIGHVFLKPLQWSRDHQEWTVDSTAFPSDLRVQGEDLWKLDLSPNVKTRSSDSLSAGSNLTIPTGWIRLDKEKLNTFDGKLSGEDILSFFDGRVPSWREALSPSIPKRALVGNLVEALKRWTESPVPSIFLLKGAGGEGKSTVLRQALCSLLADGIVREVLWNESAEDSVPWITSTSGAAKLHVIASDDAELVAKEVFRLVKEAAQKNLLHICFVLACRDTDWIAAGCHGLPWRTFAHVEELNLRGLTDGDARLIVKAWAAFGERGLGKLQGASEEDAAAALLKEAHDEAYSNEGAFLGAMLRTRIGDDIGAHVKNLLVKLGDTKAPGGTLREAFAHIAVPHAMNVLWLSQGPLATALGCGRAEIKERVLGPLGEEAVVAPTGTYILTRHRAIAEAAIRILDRDFHADTDEILIRLMTAAIELASRQVFVPQLGAWRFLSNHFQKAGKDELAVRLAQAAYKLDKNNAFFIVQFAKVLRMSAQPEASVELFRTSSAKVRRDRAFYFEWGISEGVAGYRCNSICLAAASLCDQADQAWPSTEDATRAFAGMATTFGRLYELYADRRFIEACSAAAQLGMTIKHDAAGEGYFNEADRLARDAAIDQVQPSQAVDRLNAGFAAAWERHEHDEFSQHLPPVPEFRFNRLLRLLGLAEHG